MFQSYQYNHPNVAAVGVWYGDGIEAPVVYSKLKDAILFRYQYNWADQP